MIAALADPTRRAILARLASGEASAMELDASLDAMQAQERLRAPRTMSRRQRSSHDHPNHDRHDAH